MSMLAEAKTKKRKLVSMSVLDAKTTWNSDSNFGSTLMHKLGWSKGNGLGKNEQGLTAPIRPKAQIGSLGLGAKEESLVPEHFDKLEGALAELNAKMGTVDGAQNEQMAPVKDFVHTSALACQKKIPKNVNQLSEKDLGCIFGNMNSGKKKKRVTPVPDEVNSDCQFSTMPVKIQDYFAAKMKALKAKRQEGILADCGQHADESILCPDLDFTVAKSDFSFNVSSFATPKTDATEEGIVATASGRKRRRKRTAVEDDVQLHRTEDGDSERKEKRRKKCKYDDKITSNDENVPAVIEDDVTEDRDSERKKRRKKCKYEDKISSNDEDDLAVIEDDVTEDGNGKRKEKRRKKCKYDDKITSNDKSGSISSRKKSTKRSIHVDDQDVPVVELTSVITSSDETPVVKSNAADPIDEEKRPRKKKNKTTPPQNGDSDDTVARVSSYGGDSVDASLDNQKNCNLEAVEGDPTLKSKRRRIKTNLSDSYLLATGNSPVGNGVKLKAKKGLQQSLKNIFSGDNGVGSAANPDELDQIADKPPTIEKRVKRAVTLRATKSFRNIRDEMETFLNKFSKTEEDPAAAAVKAKVEKIIKLGAPPRPHIRRKQRPNKSKKSPSATSYKKTVTPATADGVAVTSQPLFKGSNIVSIKGYGCD